VNVALVIWTGVVVKKPSPASILVLPPAAGRDAIDVAPSGVGLVPRRVESADARAEKADTRPSTITDRNHLRMVAPPETRVWLLPIAEMPRSDDWRHGESDGGAAPV